MAPPCLWNHPAYLVPAETDKIKSSPRSFKTGRESNNANFWQTSKVGKLHSCPCPQYYHKLKKKTPSKLPEPISLTHTLLPSPLFHYHPFLHTLQLYEQVSRNHQSLVSEDVCGAVWVTRDVDAASSVCGCSWGSWAAALKSSCRAAISLEQCWREQDNMINFCQDRELTFLFRGNRIPAAVLHTVKNICISH